MTTYTDQGITIYPEQPIGTRPATMNDLTDRNGVPITGKPVLCLSRVTGHYELYRLHPDTNMKEVEKFVNFKQLFVKK